MAHDLFFLFAHRRACAELLVMVVFVLPALGVLSFCHFQTCNFIDTIDTMWF